MLVVKTYSFYWEKVRNPPFFKGGFFLAMALAYYQGFSIFKKTLNYY